jgi:hypothetical protein
LYIFTLYNLMFAFVLRLQNFSIYATTLNRKAKRDGLVVALNQVYL